MFLYLNSVLIIGTRGLFALNLGRFAWLSMHSQALDFLSLARVEIAAW